MGVKKQSQPAAPDFTALAQSSAVAANLNRQTAVEQLDWAKQQYADIAPVTKAYLQQQVDSSAQQTTNAQQAQQFYESTYKPIEAQFAQTAQGYNDPARAAERSAAAQADVASAFGQQRQAALTSLEGYGIDPSQTRFGALDLGTRISQAAASATAGTQSRRETEMTGLALQGEAINIGRGYPGQVANAYNSATQAGQAGINTGLNTSNTYGNLMGTPVQYGQLQNQNLSTGAQIAGAQGNYGVGIGNLNATIGANNAKGLGQLIGAGAGLLMFSDRRVKEDIHKVGQTKGGLPVYTFRYKADPDQVVHMGVMAQEAEKKFPKAVHRTEEGIRLVDYGAIK